MPTIDMLPQLVRAEGLSGLMKVPVLFQGGTYHMDAPDLAAGFQGFIDPHHPQFGAKGDFVEYDDGAVSGTTLSSTQHVFAPADVGKYININGESRTVAAVDPGRPNGCTFSGGGFSGENLRWFMGTDDTAALNAALQAAGVNSAGGHTGTTRASPHADRQRNHGWAVLLRSGHQYLVSNSQEDFDGGKLGAIVMRKRTGLLGLADGQTTINLKPGSVGHIITQVKLDGSDHTEHLTIANLTIRGYRGYQRKALAGIRLQQPTSRTLDVNPFHSIYNVKVFECRGSGFHLGGWGELVMVNCRSIHNNEYGYFIENLVDSTFVACNAGGNQKTGFRISRGVNNRYVACKSYYSGAGGGSDLKDCANWAVYADQQANGLGFFIGCEAQESRGSSWVIENAGLCLFNGCIAGDPGRSGLIEKGTPPSVRAGFHLTGSGCRNNVFSDCMVHPSVQIYAKTNWTGTAAVHIDGLASLGDGPQANKGNIWTWLPTEGTQFGRSGTVYRDGDRAAMGAGTTNGMNRLLRVDGVELA